MLYSEEHPCDLTESSTRAGRKRTGRPRDKAGTGDRPAGHAHRPPKGRLALEKTVTPPGYRPRRPEGAPARCGKLTLAGAEGAQRDEEGQE